MDSVTDGGVANFLRQEGVRPRVQVGIPWRPAESRMVAFQMVTSWYRSRGFEILVGENEKHSQAFNLSAARNWLVSQMTTPVMILTDADTLVEEKALWQAIEGAGRDNLVHLPYHLYRNSEGEYTEGATSGTFVFTRAAWDSTNGQDERFEGWGYEDAAWRLAHLTLNGPIPRHRGTAIAELHFPASRDRVSANARLYRLYKQAYGSVEAMTELVHQTQVPTETHQDRVNARLARQARLRPLGAPRRL